MKHTAETPLFSHDLKCSECGAIFNLGEGDIRHGDLPNTFNQMPDHNRTQMRCPKCGVWEGDGVEFAMFPSSARKPE